MPHPRAAHWANRLPELLENTGRRPFWQFRVVGDGRDPARCVQHDRRIERFDSVFWKDFNPAHCADLACRCTIRAYTTAEVADLQQGQP